MKELPGFWKRDGFSAAPRQPRLGHLLLAALLTALTVMVILTPARSSAGDGLPKVLHVAFSSRVFSDVDRHDAQIAMELWARELSRKAGIPQARATIFNNITEIAEQLRRGDIHLVTLSAMEFITQRRKLKIVPAYIAANKSGRDMENLLIVRRDSGLKSIRDLKGKTLAMLPATKNEPSFIWLNVLSLKECGREAPALFAKINESSKPAQALMGVFFKQFDGAVVTRGSYETCKILNPQLGRDLAIIAASRSLAGEISCLPTTINPQLKQAIDRAAITLHESTVGKQMTTLFQIDRVIPFKPEYLAGMEELLWEWDRLTTKRGIRIWE
jgi:ABC-type phosphate/phosphonate transport system substrate-binding protein